MSRTQRAPKHTSRARDKTYCHGGVGMSRTLVRLLVRLTQLHGSQPAPEQGTDLAPAPWTSTRITDTPSNHPHQSEQRDSNPRHSAWEADALPTELCPRLRGQSINSTPCIHASTDESIHTTHPRPNPARCASVGQVRPPSAPTNIPTKNIFESP